MYSIRRILRRIRVVITITDSTRENVILFPKTIEYYQMELTRMLESEQYQEAIRLLRFLLQCKADDNRTHEEWKSLLEWMESAFSSGKSSFVLEDPQEQEETESELLKQHVKAKLEQDPQYTKKMLDILLQEGLLDKKLLALDQLTYMDHPQINDTLIRWIENVELHPLVQFKVLQTLRLREAEGQICLHKCGEELSLLVEDTPLSFEDFPLHIRNILREVVEVSEVNQPTLLYFAEQTWKEFLYYIYGTSMYEQLLEQEGAEGKVWAAALHQVVLETMSGPSEEKAALSLYRIEEERIFLWELAYRVMKNYMESAFRPN